MGLWDHDQSAVIIATRSAEAITQRHAPTTAFIPRFTSSGVMKKNLINSQIKPDRITWAYGALR